MTNLRICVRFEHCDPEFYALAMHARPFSELLRCIEFIQPDYHLGYDDLVADITVLVPSDLAQYWDNICDGVSVEHMGHHIVHTEIMRVCKREQILSLEELYG